MKAELSEPLSIGALALSIALMLVALFQYGIPTSFVPVILTVIIFIATVCFWPGWGAPTLVALYFGLQWAVYCNLGVTTISYLVLCELLLGAIVFWRFRKKEGYLWFVFMTFIGLGGTSIVAAKGTGLENSQPLQESSGYLRIVAESGTAVGMERVCAGLTMDVGPAPQLTASFEEESPDALLAQRE